MALRQRFGFAACIVVLAILLVDLSNSLPPSQPLHQTADEREGRDLGRDLGLGLEVDSSSGSHRLFVGGKLWLNGAPAFFTIKGKRYSTASGGGLKLVSTDSEEGSDELGPWNATVLTYSAADAAGTEVKVAFKQFLYFKDIILFGQIFPDGVSGTSNGDRNSVCTGFPSFFVESSGQEKEKEEEGDGRLRFDHHRSRPGTAPAEKLGYLAYGGIMFGDTSKKTGRWNSEEVKRITSGLDSGPLVLFSASGDDVLVVSPFSQFMVASAAYAETGDGQMSASWGLMGTIPSIPAQFTLWTIASYSNQGINEAISRWGAVLRMKYNRGTEYRDSDMTNNYLGFWTDNGAYYYYKTEPGLNYEDTMISEVKYARQNGIPYRYIQYDSWFYYKGSDKGVTEWKGMPSIFPNGMQYVWNQTGLISVAHNRWWSFETVYAKQHGGKYNFVVEPSTKKALPTDQEFWDDLLQESRKWGLIVYEQDWLNDQFDEMDATVSNITLGRQWLLQMGKGARKNGLTIQYCMAPSRHALQSLEIPVVSQARVSGDYQPGNDQWKIGISSMFAHAIGVAPFKDNFWTTYKQPGNPYNLTEPYPDLESIVATLSTGPVAPSDRIGYSNKKLIMRSCNADGLILKPSKPATALNRQILESAFDGFKGEVWSTYSFISGWIFGIILAADCKPFEKIDISPVEAGFGRHFPDSVIYSWFEPERTVPFTESKPVTLTGCTKSPFCLYLSSPVITTKKGSKIILYGELDKWVSMSPNRVPGIRRVGDDITVLLQGASRERVTFTYSIDGETTHLGCALGKDGTGWVEIPSGKCRS